MQDFAHHAFWFVNFCGRGLLGCCNTVVFSALPANFQEFSSSCKGGDLTLVLKNVKKKVSPRGISLFYCYFQSSFALGSTLARVKRLVSPLGGVGFMTPGGLW
jgi:hypothetical protein